MCLEKPQAGKYVHIQRLKALQSDSGSASDRLDLVFPVLMLAGVESVQFCHDSSDAHCLHHPIALHFSARRDSGSVSRFALIRLVYFRSY